MLEEGAAAGGDLGGEVRDAAGPEFVLAAGGVRQVPVGWFDDDEGEDWPVCGGLGEGGVVLEAEVAFEPDDLGVGREHRGNRA